jgi:hypothetical protein
MTLIPLSWGDTVTNSKQLYRVHCRPLCTLSAHCAHCMLGCVLRIYPPTTSQCPSDVAFWMRGVPQKVRGAWSSAMLPHTSRHVLWFLCILCAICHQDLLQLHGRCMDAGLLRESWRLAGPQHHQHRIRARPAAAGAAAAAYAISGDGMALLSNIRWPAVAGALAAGLSAVAFVDARRKTR